MSNANPYGPIRIPREWIAYTRPDGTLVLHDMPPATYRKRRKALRERFARCREYIAKYRSEMAQARDQWDRDNAAGQLGMLQAEHHTAQCELLLLRSVTVRKFAHVSPNAAKRLQRK